MMQSLVLRLVVAISIVVMVSMIFVDVYKQYNPYTHLRPGLHLFGNGNSVLVPGPAPVYVPDREMK